MPSIHLESDMFVFSKIKCAIIDLRLVLEKPCILPDSIEYFSICFKPVYTMNVHGDVLLLYNTSIFKVDQKKLGTINENFKDHLAFSKMGAN